MVDLDELFHRQAEWQKSRARLSWSEKLEMAAVLRDAALALRRPAAAGDRGWIRNDLYDGRRNRPR